jgi:hypothetical protein
MDNDKEISDLNGPIVKEMTDMSHETLHHHGSENSDKPPTSEKQPKVVSPKIGGNDQNPVEVGSKTPPVKNTDTADVVKENKPVEKEHDASGKAIKTISSLIDSDYHKPYHTNRDIYELLTDLSKDDLDRIKNAFGTKSSDAIGISRELADRTGQKPHAHDKKYTPDEFVDLIKGHWKKKKNSFREIFEAAHGHVGLPEGQHDYVAKKLGYTPEQFRQALQKSQNLVDKFKKASHEIYSEKIKQSSDEMKEGDFEIKNDQDKTGTFPGWNKGNYYVVDGESAGKPDTFHILFKDNRGIFKPIDSVDGRDVGGDDRDKIIQRAKQLTAIFHHHNITDQEKGWKIAEQFDSGIVPDGFKWNHVPEEIETEKQDKADGVGKGETATVSSDTRKEEEQPPANPASNANRKEVDPTSKQKEISTESEKPREEPKQEQISLDNSHTNPVIDSVIKGDLEKAHNLLSEMTVEEQSKIIDIVKNTKVEGRGKNYLELLIKQFERGMIKSKDGNGNAVSEEKPSGENDLVESYSRQGEEEVEQQHNDKWWSGKEPLVKFDQNRNYGELDEFVGGREPSQEQEKIGPLAQRVSENLGSELKPDLAETTSVTPSPDVETSIGLSPVMQSEGEELHNAALRSFLGDEYADHYGKYFDKYFKEFDNLPEKEKEREYRGNENRGRSFQSELGAKVTYAGGKIGLTTDGMRGVLNRMKMLADAQKANTPETAAQELWQMTGDEFAKNQDRTSSEVSSANGEPKNGEDRTKQEKMAAPNADEPIPTKVAPEAQPESESESVATTKTISDQYNDIKKKIGSISKRINQITSLNDDATESEFQELKKLQKEKKKLRDKRAELEQLLIAGDNGNNIGLSEYQELKTKPNPQNTGLSQSDYVSEKPVVEKTGIKANIGENVFHNGQEWTVKYIDVNGDRVLEKDGKTVTVPFKVLRSQQNVSKTEERKQTLKEAFYDSENKDLYIRNLSKDDRLLLAQSLHRKDLEGNKEHQELIERLTGSYYDNPQKPQGTNIVPPKNNENEYSEGNEDDILKSKTPVDVQELYEKQNKISENISSTIRQISEAVHQKDTERVLKLKEHKKELQSQYEELESQIDQKLNITRKVNNLGEIIIDSGMSSKLVPYSISKTKDGKYSVTFSGEGVSTKPGKFDSYEDAENHAISAKYKLLAKEEPEQTKEIEDDSDSLDTLKDDEVMIDPNTGERLLSKRYKKFISNDMLEKHGAESDEIDFKLVPKEQKQRYNDLVKIIDGLLSENDDIDKKHYGDNYEHYRDVSELLAKKGSKWADKNKSLIASSKKEDINDLIKKKKELKEEIKVCEYKEISEELQKLNDLLKTSTGNKKKITAEIKELEKKKQEIEEFLDTSAADEILARKTGDKKKLVKEYEIVLGALYHKFSGIERSPKHIKEAESVFKRMMSASAQLTKLSSELASKYPKDNPDEYEEGDSGPTPPTDDNSGGVLPETPKGKKEKDIKPTDSTPSPNVGETVSNVGGKWNKIELPSGKVAWEKDGKVTFENPEQNNQIETQVPDDTKNDTNEEINESYGAKVPEDIGEENRIDTVSYLHQNGENKLKRLLIRKPIADLIDIAKFQRIAKTPTILRMSREEIVESLVKHSSQRLNQGSSFIKDRIQPSDQSYDQIKDIPTENKENIETQDGSKPANNTGTSASKIPEAELPKSEEQIKTGVKDVKEQQQREQKEEIKAEGDGRGPLAGPEHGGDTDWSAFRTNDGIRDNRPVSPKLWRVRSEHEKTANTGLLAESVIPHLKDEQKEGAALAIESMENHGGFINQDGTGAGKSRQQLAIAETFAKKGKKVIIIAPNQVIKPNFQTGKFFGSFDSDSRSMGISPQLYKGGPLEPGKINITTYEKLADTVDHVDDDTVVLFDEAHKLKNSKSNTSILGNQIIDKCHSVGYFTATPGDKAEHIDYLRRAGIYGQIGRAETYAKLGLRLVKSRIAGKESVKWSPAPGITNNDIAKRIEALFTQAAKDGLTIRRELDLKGVHFVTERMNLLPNQHQELAELYERVISELGPRGTGSAMLQVRMHQEKFKIPLLVDNIKKDIAHGRRPVIFLSKVNDKKTEEGDGDEHIDYGTLSLLKEELVKAGVKPEQISELHGGITKKQQPKHVERFQNGQSLVMIATPQSGGTGINLDDTVGDSPRSIHILTPAFSANDTAQIIGRVHRMNTRSGSNVHSYLSDNAIDEWNGQLLDKKLRQQGAITSGDVSGKAKNLLSGIQLEPDEEDYDFNWGRSLITNEPDGTESSQEPPKRPVEQQDQEESPIKATFHKKNDKTGIWELKIQSPDVKEGDIVTAVNKAGVRSQQLVSKILSRSNGYTIAEMGKLPKKR